MDKHDTYVALLKEKLQNDYDRVLTHVPLYRKAKKTRKIQLIAEIDVVAYRGDICDIFEVKCSYRVAKAKKQLYKIRKIFSGVSQAFFFCGASQELELIL